MLLQTYSYLEAAYSAIAERLNSSDGDYMFGNSPSSLDALLYGHLAFHQAAPVSSPEIQHQVTTVAFVLMMLLFLERMLPACRLLGCSSFAVQRHPGLSNIGPSAKVAMWESGMLKHKAQFQPC